MFLYVFFFTYLNFFLTTDIFSYLKSKNITYNIPSLTVKK